MVIQESMEGEQGVAVAEPCNENDNPHVMSGEGG